MTIRVGEVARVAAPAGLLRQLEDLGASLPGETRPPTGEGARYRARHPPSGAISRMACALL
jgi:hypothetical protein